MRHRVILSLGIVLLASACDRKAEGQTVAVVNDEEITTAELNAELANANLPPDVDRKQATARILQGLIDRRLLAQQAREDGVDTSPDFLNRQRRMTEDLLIGMMAQRQMNSAKLPTAQEIQQVQAAQPQIFGRREIWDLEQVAYPTPKDPAVQQRILGTKNLNQLTTVLSQAGVQFQRGKNRLDSATIPADLFGRLSTLPSGEPFIIPMGAQSVASVVVARQPAPLDAAAARTAAVEVIRRQQGQTFMEGRLKSLRQGAQIEYKEGYGPPPAASAAKK